MRGQMLSAIILVLCVFGSGAVSPSADSILLQLDEAIRVRDSYETNLQATAESKRMILHSSAPEDVRFEALKDLYGFYESYQLDSARNIAYRLTKMALSMNDPRRIYESRIIQALSRTKSGYPDDALRILNEIDRKGLTGEMLEQLYSAYFTAYNYKQRTEKIDYIRKDAAEKASEYMDSLLSYLPEGSVGHTYLSAVRLDDKGMTLKAVELLESAADRPEFADNASFQFGLGTMLLKTGRREEAINAIAKASLLDVKGGKKEYMAMIKLAALLCEEGDIPRAFNYIRLALDDVSFSHADIRTPEMLEVMPVIDSAYRAYEAAELKSATRNTLLASGFAILAFIVLLILWVQFRRISAIKAALDLSNKELSERNRQLTLADSLKLRHIDDLLSIHAANIANIKAYRKTLHRMMISGQYSRVTDKLKSDKPASEEVKAFYDIFDSTFLSLYPDFINEVNGYMSSPLSLDGAEGLTPELRIIALMKLGVSSTSEIAAMLQYSLRTVYNYRSALRASLNCSWEQFEKEIAVDNRDFETKINEN